MSQPQSWHAAPALDPEVVRRHLDEHGVFDAADELFDRVERGEPLGEAMSPADVRAWLADRCEP